MIEQHEPGVDIAAAVRLLRAGKTVAFPTETVYGLGADAANPAAVRRIFELKGRPANHPLIVHIPSAESLTAWARDIPEQAWLLAERFWPGPLTLILPRHPAVPLEVTGGQESIGLRVPDHPLALELLRHFDGGLAAPSANRFGRISPTCAAHVRDELGEQVEMVLDGGPCLVGLESTIVSLIGPRPCLLRPGQISIAEIAEVLGCKLEIPQSSPTIRAPGLLASHYAPKTPLILRPASALCSWLKIMSERGCRVAVMALTPPQTSSEPAARVDRIPMPLQPQEYARELYASLRRLDAGGFDYICAEKPPATKEWLAVHDRLNRAAITPENSFIAGETT